MWYYSEESFRASLAKGRTCIALVGISGALKNEVASILVPSSSLVTVSTVVWEQYLRRALEEYLVQLISSNSELKYYVGEHAVDIVSTPKRSLAAAAGFMGTLGDPALGGSSLEDFQGRMDQYRLAVRQAMQNLEREFALQRAHSVISTTSSLSDVLNWDDLDNDPVVKFLRARCFLVNVMPSKKRLDEILHEGYEHLRPDFYSESLIARHLPGLLESLGAEKVTQCDPAEIMGHLYEWLIAERLVRNLRLAEVVGGVTIWTRDDPETGLINSSPNEIYEVIGDAIGIDRDQRWKKIRDDDEERC